MAHSSEQFLTGEINVSTVLGLEFLSYLDLSWNNFTTINYSTLDGKRNENLLLSTPSHSSTLQHLDLSGNVFLRFQDIRWLSHIPSLKYLDLSGSDLSSVTDWLHSLTTILPSISEVRLAGCRLMHINSSLGHVNFTSLKVLDLSKNLFDSNIPNWVSNLSDSFFHLDLSSNNFHGQIPNTLSNLRNLKSLLLSGNKLNGTIPGWLGQYKHLQVLDLSYNSFQGSVPPTLGNLSSLTLFDIGFNHLNGSFPESIWQLSFLETLTVGGGNSFTGVLSETHFAKLSNLKVLDLSLTAFLFDFGSTWVPPFQLQELYLRYCLLGPKFPAWLYTQNSLSTLDVSSSGISTIDHHDKFWRFVENNITFLVDLSNNSIIGDISTLVLNAVFIDLSSNNISGGLPRLTPHVDLFLIGNNSFSGPISYLLCDSKSHGLVYLDMSYNLLVGELPDCWMNWKFLSYINLGNNNLTGKLPNSFGLLSMLHTLHLHSNNFFGDVPLSLQNCKQLVLLDLRENKLSGSIPSWMGQNMGAIIMRSNQFRGNIPSQICQISSLIILDLADNQLFGPIPNCLHNISFMSKENWFIGFSSIVGQSELLDYYSVTLHNKGQELEYQRNFGFVRLIDLSCNNLSGTIPSELFGLSQLNILNLSHNHLLGRISQEIGQLKLLESLDLSRNQLSGEIPQSISGLSFLSFLNLSYNNLIGKIPLATQLQSFDAMSYIGNHKLCGPPLTVKCAQDEGIVERNLNREEDDDDEMLSYFYFGMGVGFAIGFWGVCAMIFFNKTCRHAYFIFLNHMKDYFISFVLLMIRALH